MNKTIENIVILICVTIIWVALLITITVTSRDDEKINSLIKKLEKDSEEQQWIQTADDEYLAHTEKAMYADELLSFLRGEE